MNSQQPEADLAIERRDGAVVARFTREVVLTGHQAEAIAGRLTALLTEPGTRLLLDFGNVRSLSSLMLGKLIVLNRTAEAVGGRLALFDLRPDVREILALTRLNLLLHLYGDEQEALHGA